jgi:hypothetical protein
VLEVFEVREDVREMKGAKKGRVDSRRREMKKEGEKGWTRGIIRRELEWRERGSVRSRQRLREFSIVEAGRWRQKRGTIRGRSSNQSLEVSAYVIDNKCTKKFLFYFH